MCDRLEKRKVMIGGRSVLALSSLVIAVLLYLGSLKPVHIAIAAMVEGVAFSFTGPAMQTIVSELSDRETLLNAVSVSAVFHNGMGIVGALVAGLLVESVGAVGVYLCMTLLFCFAVYTLFKLPKGSPGNGAGRAVHTDLVDGVRYLRTKPVLMAVLGLAFTRFLFAQPYRDFLPAFAQDDLGLSAVGLGLLTSATGIGAFVASLVGASVGDTRHKGALLLASGVAIGISLLLLMSVRALPAVLLFVFLEACFSGTGQVLTSTLLQSHSDTSYRGRTAGVYMMLMGLSRFAVVPAGAMVDRVGVPMVASAMAVVVIGVYLAVAFLWPGLRKLR